MKNLLLLAASTMALLVLCAQPVMAQGGARAIYYCPDDGLHPLGCGCEEATRVPFEDGWGYCIFWDNNANGPDESDIVVPVGTEPGFSNQSCWTFNGVAEGCGVGFFYTSNPLFGMQVLPISPDTALYYVKVSGTNCCWTSTSFTVAQGLNEDLYLAYGDWTCADEACCSGFDVPAAPTDVQASNDAYCLSVSVTWQHSGDDVTGFTVYQDGVSMTTAGAEARQAFVDVCLDGQLEYSVVAVNGCESSDPVSTMGSTYLRHLAPGIGGSYDGGGDLVVQLTRPPLDGYCPANVWFDLYSNDNHVARLCSLTTLDSLLELDLICTLPNTALTNCYLVMSCISPITQCASTDTSDMFQITVDAESDPGIVREFSLAQNYPNPFNPDTRIEFSIPTNSDVSLAVYDLQGRLVTNLISTSLAAGRHSVNWNARDNAGSPVAAGLYFYSLRAGNYVQTKKMLLLK